MRIDLEGIELGPITVDYDGRIYAAPRPAGRYRWFQLLEIDRPARRVVFWNRSDRSDQVVVPLEAAP